MGEREVRVIDELQEALPREDVVAALADPATQERLQHTLDRLAAPDFEVRMAGPDRIGPEGDFVGRGITGFIDVWSEWTSVFQSFGIEIEETIDAGDVVLSLVRIRARSRTDGVAVEQPAAATWTVRHGRLTKVEFQLDRDAAIRAAGYSSARRP